MFPDIGDIKRWRHPVNLKGICSWKQLILVVVLLLILTVIKLQPRTNTNLYWNYPPPDSIMILKDNGDDNTVKFNSTITKCGPPTLNPWNKDVLPFFSRPEDVNCSNLFNQSSTFSGIAFTIKKGNQLHRLVDMGVKCCFQPFYRDTDDFIKYGERCFKIRRNITVIPKGMNYIQLLCSRKGQNSTMTMYRDAFPIIHRPIVTPTSQDSRPLNIVIIGLDATSRLNFQRQMPLSTDYLGGKMRAISLEGYSVLGSGSQVNIIPMLTGLSLRYPLTYYSNQSEFYKKCVSIHPNNFSQCPFIWNDFSKRGYITNFADDWTIFNAYWPKAFSKPPTDFYFRPYQLHMEKFSPTRSTSHFCFGPRLSFQAILDYMESVREVADKLDRPHFQFTWTGRLAHDNINTLGYGDIPLLRSLMKFKESGAWNDTVIMILGDHGNNKEGYFESPAGQIEYRMPVAYIVLPPWFSKRYPMSYKNLVKNSKNRMTTAFDIYETLQDLMEWNEPWNSSRVGDHNKGRRGISLFKVIPKNRSCLQAEVSPKWCHLCHPPILMKKRDPLTRSVANVLIKMINSLGYETSRDNCVIQSLESVITAWKRDPRDVILEFCNQFKNLDIGRYQGYFHFLPQNSTVSCHLVDIVNVQFITKPAGAIYHGEVMLIKHDNRMDMYLTDDIQRLDRFSLTGNCVKESIKRYCICKSHNQFNFSG